MRILLMLFPVFCICFRVPRLGWSRLGGHQFYPINAINYTKSSHHPGAQNCTTKWFDQYIDHFQYGAIEQSASLFWKQRYLVYDKYYKPGGPIFFYCGNEGQVESYADHTGLMWENAPEFNAYLIFAEHRYYGKSQPSSNNRYCTHEQALADYARLLFEIKHNLTNGGMLLEPATIAFGGSYGGMLAAWFRMKYPSAVDGAIAASAPILAFPNMDPPFQTETYWQVVTHDATPAAGSAEHCVDYVRKSWSIMDDLAKDDQGRKQLSHIFKACVPMKSVEQVLDLKEFLLLAWDTMAMANYPFPNDYLSPIPMPPFPVRVACDFMEKADPTDNSSILTAQLLATNVLNNVTQDVKCFHIFDEQQSDIKVSSENIFMWDYQWCTQLQCQETYWEMDGVHDMFWPFSYNITQVNEHCQKEWGVIPRTKWIAISYGGRSLAGSSNIVFSNGLLDPWSSGGVLPGSLPPGADSLAAVTIPNGAHHLDLMFSDPSDDDDVKAARKLELDHIRKWINNKHIDSPKIAAAI